MARCARNDCGRWRPDVLARGSRAGLRLDGAWYCSTGCVEQVTRRRLVESGGPSAAGRRRMPPVKLGTLLVHQASVTPGAVAQALQEQRTTGLRLGAQLLRMGLVTARDVTRALAAQAGVAYLTTIDPACVHAAPGQLSVGTVRTLRLVPFEADFEAGLLKVACSAPLPRLAIAALAELTGCRVEPFLVPDDQWPALVEAYGAAVAAAPPAPAVRDVGAAAAWIARAVADGRAQRMAHARVDPYVWVRLEGGARTEDLLLPLGTVREEERWQAAPTRH